MFKQQGYKHAVLDYHVRSVPIIEIAQRSIAWRRRLLGILQADAGKLSTGMPIYLCLVCDKLFQHY